ncbi:MAG: hypothetical protein ACRELY_24860 [Polyangiaceae bacterium]
MNASTLGFFSATALAAIPLACSSSGSTSAPGACAAPYDAIVAASDYSSSSLGGCTLDGGASLPFKGVDLGSDPALASSNGRVFYLARDMNAIFELDPQCASPRTKLDVSDTGSRASTNPQDVAVASDGSMWIPRFNVPTLLVLDANGKRPASNPTIDLSSHDPDGNPNASAIRIEEVGGAEKAFVALERLDDKKDANGNVFVSRLPSSMVRIDVGTRNVEAEAMLAGRDPFGTIDESNGAFFLAAPGNFDSATEDDAGIERFDPASFTTTYMLKESDLGASVTEVAVNGACGAAIVADPTVNVNATSLVTFDADHGTAITTTANAILSTAGFDLSGLAWRGDTLFVGDRRAGGGGKYPIHVFDRSGEPGASCTLTERADSIFVTQKPVTLRSTPP